jgi:hypothetical protein
MTHTENYLRDPDHRDGVQDSDLMNIYLKHNKTLPWIQDLLEEVQALRNVHKEQIDQSDANDTRMQEAYEIIQTAHDNIQDAASICTRAYETMQKLQDTCFDELRNIELTHTKEGLQNAEGLDEEV